MAKKGGTCGKLFKINNMQKQRVSGIAMIRVDLGITQRELADTLGISRATVSMAELGQRPMPERAREYLYSLMEISRRLPPAAPVSRRTRPSVAQKRPRYNRIPTSRRANGEQGQIVTLDNSLPVLSPQEVRKTGERLRERFIFDGTNHPAAADACQELLLTLQQKAAFTQCNIDLLEFKRKRAPERALEIKAQLILLNGRLGHYRGLNKSRPGQRKRWRRIITALYLKKLQAQAKLEKFNKPAIKKIKEQVGELQEQLYRQLKMAVQVEERIKELAFVE